MSLLLRLPHMQCKTSFDQRARRRVTLQSYEQPFLAFVLLRLRLAVLR